MIYQGDSLRVAHYLEDDMAEKTKCGYCKNCQCETLIYKPKVNHWAHGLASLILINWWIPWFIVWFAASFFNFLTGYRCKKCGKTI